MEEKDEKPDLWWILYTFGLYDMINIIYPTPWNFQYTSKRKK